MVSPAAALSLLRSQPPHALPAVRRVQVKEVTEDNIICEATNTAILDGLLTVMVGIAPKFPTFPKPKQRVGVG